MKSEKGQALPLAMMALAFGTLVIAPFLGHASSSINGSRIYEQGIVELYSGDAGIELAIWSLGSGALVVPEGDTAALDDFAINDRTVAVTVANQGGNIYLITSTATSGDGHSTMLRSYVSYGGGGNWSSDGDIGEDTEGDVYIDGDASIGGNVEVDGSVYATGDVVLGNNAGVTGDVAAGGDLDLHNNAYIGGDVFAGGDLTLDNNSEIGSIEVGGDVCAGGSVYLANNTVIYGNLTAGGNIDMLGNAVVKGDVYISASIATIILRNNAIIEGNIYITGSVTDRIDLDNNARIYGDVYATGTINNIVREGNILGDVHENYGGTYPPAPD